MSPFSANPSSPTPDNEASVGDWQRTRRGALNERAQNRTITQADYQPGEATTGGPTNLNVTRRQLSDAGAARLANVRGMRDSAFVLNQARKEQRSDKQQISVGNALRHARQIRRNERDQTRGGKARAAGAAIANVAGQIITAELLKQSWLNLITSFGLTLLYIDFHFVVRYLAGSQMFCRFGMEWFSIGKLASAGGTGTSNKTTPPPATPSGSKNTTSTSGGDNDTPGGKSAKEYATELASKPIEILEFIVLGLCNVLVLTVLVGVATIIALLAGGWFGIVGAAVSSVVSG